MSRSELMDRIKGLLGGRAAEELVLGEVSTGAENDLERATAHAINEEVKSLLQELYAEAKQILTEHRDELDRVTRALLEQETLDEGTFQRLFSGAMEVSGPEDVGSATDS